MNNKVEQYILKLENEILNLQNKIKILKSNQFTFKIDKELSKFKIKDYMVEIWRLEKEKHFAESII